MTGVYFAPTGPKKRPPIQRYTRQRDDDEGDVNESGQDEPDDHAENVNDDSHNNKDDMKSNGYYNDASADDGSHNKDDRTTNGYSNDAGDSDESGEWTASTHISPLALIISSATRAP